MNFTTVTKEPIEVQARGPIQTTETLHVHSGELQANKGYFIIDNGTTQYPVEPNIFHDTYQVPDRLPHPDTWFTIKKQPIQVQAKGPLETTHKIQTLEGTVTAKPRNYIIKGVNGEKYPITNNEFNRLYQHKTTPE